MREIKFRLWNKDARSFVKDFDARGVEVVAEITLLNTLVNTLSNLDAYIIQQYTGLKDRKDKEIYEGNIIKYSPYYIDEEDFNENAVLCKVEWGQKSYGGKTGFDILKMSDNIAYDMYGGFRSEDSEVVGNIFEK